MQRGIWARWGICCLSFRERHYQPLSNHNGSIWPHDNELIAAGAVRFGMTKISEMT